MFERFFPATQKPTTVASLHEDYMEVTDRISEIREQAVQLRNETEQEIADLTLDRDTLEDLIAVIDVY